MVETAGIKFKKTAYLFPGQGAQYSGMALDLLSSDKVKLLFDTASEILKQDIKEILSSGTDNLKRTDVSQPAITAANLAASVFLEDQGFAASAYAGFSLGEYAALVCAGIIGAADCFRLIKARGEAMQKAADSLREKSGEAPGMAAVVGLDPAQAENLIAQWKAEGLNDLFAANINSPKQLVVSGTAAALKEAETRFKEAGAKRVIRLQVAGPFHSPLIIKAADSFAESLESVSFNDPVMPVFSNVTGKKISSGKEAKELAVKQITSPVRWVDIEKEIVSCGVDVCLETGPGKVLQGLWKDASLVCANGNEIPVFAAGTMQDINNLIIHELSS